jgi:hypothetical protein
MVLLLRAIGGVALVDPFLAFGLKLRADRSAVVVRRDTIVIAARKRSLILLCVGGDDGEGKRD